MPRLEFPNFTVGTLLTATELEPTKFHSVDAVGSIDVQDALRIVLHLRDSSQVEEWFEGIAPYLTYLVVMGEADGRLLTGFVYPKLEGHGVIGAEISEPFWQLAAGCPQLRSLTISGARVNWPNDWEKSVAYLSLHDCSSADGWAGLRSLVSALDPSLPSTLHLLRNEGLTTADVPMPFCSSLEVLWLSLGVSPGRPVDLSGLASLKSLRLRGTAVDDQELEGLAGHEVLEELVLSGTKVSDASAVLLSQLPSLKAVDLSDTLMSKEAADWVVREVAERAEAK